MNLVENNLIHIQNQINECCEKNGIDYNKIKLIAVTKTRNADEINRAIQAGALDIGENKVQEIMDKHQLVSDVQWHMIGHLQTNKVKYIIDKVHMIHSLDSMKLAGEINKRAYQINKIMDVLVQVNAAEEESKYGLSINEAQSFIETLKKYENIHVKGLMTIAPFAKDPEEVRKYFKQMKQLFDDCKHIESNNITMQYLSMGMTNDFEVAIEEGANMIRIGTAIFGPRNY